MEKSGEDRESYSGRRGRSNRLSYRRRLYPL